LEGGQRFDRCRQLGDHGDLFLGHLEVFLFDHLVFGRFEVALPAEQAGELQPGLGLGLFFEVFEGELEVEDALEDVERVFGVAFVELPAQQGFEAGFVDGAEAWVRPDYRCRRSRPC
jgi:hypothetical protein